MKIFFFIDYYLFATVSVRISPLCHRVSYTAEGTPLDRVDRSTAAFNNVPMYLRTIDFVKKEEEEKCLYEPYIASTIITICSYTCTNIYIYKSPIPNIDIMCAHGKKKKIIIKRSYTLCVEKNVVRVYEQIR